MFGDPKFFEIGGRANDFEPMVAMDLGFLLFDGVVLNIRRSLGSERMALAVGLAGPLPQSGSDSSG